MRSLLGIGSIWQLCWVGCWNGRRCVHSRPKASAHQERTKTALDGFADSHAQLNQRQRHHKQV
jgi:hypothetical protein